MPDGLRGGRGGVGMIYSHDTGEDRPLVEFCDECDHDPETCGMDVTDCMADFAEAMFEGERDARD